MSGKPELKPGVMAITHGLVVDTGCNDMLVELIEFVPAGMFWRDPHGYWQLADCGSWGVRSLGSMFPESRAVPPVRHALFAPYNLRPIRDPGDDAVDESHAWLPPVPQEVTT